MRNITGSPVEQDDFFERPQDLVRLRRELANSANLLLTAPRRVGKTSLALRLCALEREAKRHAVYINVEGCHDELAFVEKRVDSLNAEGLHPDLMGRIAALVQKACKLFTGVKVASGGLDLEISDAGSPDISTLTRCLEVIFHKIDVSDKSLLLAIDEMPELLLAISRQEQGSERVTRLLHLLRALRQSYRKRVRWLFLGSIGLDSFVDDRNLRKTINDLTSVSLDALSVAQANAFLLRLSEGKTLTLTAAQRTQIIERIGWPLPHHLQLVFHTLVDADVQQASDADIARALTELPRQHSHFDTWRQRLDDQFGESDARAAHDVLRHLCLHVNGRSRAQLINALMATRHTADITHIQAQLAQLLQVLQRDGYLLENKSRYSFRSFLLREFWYHREMR
jgi:uncharacterized protein